MSSNGESTHPATPLGHNRTALVREVAGVRRELRRLNAALWTLSLVAVASLGAWMAQLMAAAR
jgi:hypothetical protein